MPRSPSHLSTTLASAIASLRKQLGDPTAPIAVLTPSSANGVLLRQQLGLATSFIRVDFWTPERLVRSLGAPALARASLSAEPAGWLSATLGVVLTDLSAKGALGKHSATLAQPGWKRAVAQAVDRLENAGVEPATLLAVQTTGIDDRAHILGTVLAELRQRRRADRLYGLAQLCAAAMRSLDNETEGVHDIRGAVVLGDRILAPGVHGVLRAWLETRPHIELRIAPLSSLDESPRGLRSACTDQVLEVAAPPGALGGVLANLWNTGPEVPADPTVALVSTPDEQRELREAVREAQRAIADGVALESIAFVLPDAQHAGVLEGLLQHAGIPATWLTGPSLAEKAPARFLRHFLAMAAGGDSAEAWYQLLRDPGLRLRARLGPKAVRKRGRWRRILADCGAVVGTGRLVEAVAKWAESRDEAHDPDGDREAATSLLSCMRRLGELAAELDGEGSLGMHGRRWADLVDGWYSRSRNQARLLQMLRSWGAPGVGPRLALAVAVAELEEQLAGVAALDGSLTEPKVRVVSPMSLLGGAFERVFVTGLTEGRFPGKSGEHALLSDALIDELDRGGAQLLDSQTLAGFHQRRFASMLTAATERVWLSVPRMQLLEGRPWLPSRFTLDVGSALLGRRAGFEDVRELAPKVGSRARPFDADPEHAVGAIEYLIARLRHEPEPVLVHLATHPMSRRLLGFHLATVSGEAPGAWTARIDPSILPAPGLDGEVLQLKVLLGLLQDPGDFFFRRMLGAWAAKRFPGAWDPLDRYALRDGLSDAIEAAMAAKGRFVESGVVDFDETAEARGEFQDVEPAVVDVAREIMRLRLGAFEAAAGHPKTVAHDVTGAIDPSLPWRVETTVKADGSETVTLDSKVPAKGQFVRDQPGAVAANLAAQAAGLPVTELVFFDPNGKRLATTAEDWREELVTKLDHVTEAAKLGWYPFASNSKLGLSIDGQVDVHANIELARRLLGGEE